MQNDALKRVEQMKQNAESVVTRANSELSEMTETSINNEKEKSKEKARHVPMPDDYIKDLKAYAKKAALPPPVPSSSPKKSNPSPQNTPQNTLSTLINSCENLPNALKNVLSDFNIDSDRALLLSLILLLAEERGDEFLIISLLYMMI